MATPAEILTTSGLANADLIVQAAEVWLPVPGYEGRYEISDRGNARSLDRVVADGRHYKGKLIVGSFDTDGYRQIGLRASNGTRKTWKIHALVLLAFVGPRPEGYFACHNNGDNTDNRLSNLRWDTAAANAADAIAHGTQTNVRKTHCPRGHRLAAPNLVHVYEVAGTRDVPAHAGVSPLTNGGPCQQHRRPRARGGEPCLTSSNASRSRTSPRTRG